MMSQLARMIRLIKALPPACKIAGSMDTFIEYRQIAGLSRHAAANSNTMPKSDISPVVLAIEELLIERGFRTRAGGAVGHPTILGIISLSSDDNEDYAHISCYATEAYCVCGSDVPIVCEYCDPDMLTILERYLRSNVRQ